MKQGEKSALSRQRILEAALSEFSQKGYDGASLSSVCGGGALSKGLIYHYFKDKDELYLQCAAACFDRLTACLAAAWEASAGTTEQRLQAYFDARLRFFAMDKPCAGMFLSAVLNPPAHLAQRLCEVRSGFDALNRRVLTELLESAPLQAELSAASVAEEFGMYADYFNARFGAALAACASPAQALREHEERSHRQLGILLHGVLRR